MEKPYRAIVSINGDTSQEDCVTFQEAKQWIESIVAELPWATVTWQIRSNRRDKLLDCGGFDEGDHAGTL